MTLPSAEIGLEILMEIAGRIVETLKTTMKNYSWRIQEAESLLI